MKKTVIVTITKSLEVEIPDEMLTDEYLEEFSFDMFHVHQQEELFEYAAQYIARFDRSFVEGLGNLKYTENYEDVESEVL